jgi:hypothetical protein
VRVSKRFLNFEAAPTEFRSGGAMTLQTQGADVLKIAFAPAFNDGYNVIGVPQSFSRALPPTERSFQASGAAETFELPLGLQAIDPATGANAAIAFQDSLANVAWIAAEPPFFHAPGGTKRHAAFRDLQIAPTAQIAAVRPLRKCAPIGPAA